MQRDPDQQQTFQSALAAIGEEESLAPEQLDALSHLEGADVGVFAEVWRPLPAGARARSIRALHTAAAERLRLDFSLLNDLALNDPDAEVRLAGVQCAIEDQSPRLLSRLLDMLKHDPSGAVRRAVAEDLARFALLGELETLEPAATRQVRTALLGTLHNENEELGVRSAALAALGYFSDQAIAEELAQAFTQPELRLGAVRGMGRSADPRWTDRLMPVLGSEDPDLRLEAARALGEIEDERAVGPLAEAIDDPDRDVRLAVVRALGEIGGEEAREALFYAIEDDDPAVREAAEKALSDIEFYEDPLAL